MGLSMGSVELAANRRAKAGMEHMLKDLAEGIREQRSRVSANDGFMLQLVADEMDKIDPGEYFGRIFP